MSEQYFVAVMHSTSNLWRTCWGPAVNMDAQAIPSKHKRKIQIQYIGRKIPDNRPHHFEKKQDTNRANI